MTNRYEEFMTQMKAWEKGQAKKPSIYLAADLLRTMKRDSYLEGYYDGIERGS